MLNKKFVVFFFTTLVSRSCFLVSCRLFIDGGDIRFSMFHKLLWLLYIVPLFSFPLFQATIHHLNVFFSHCFPIFGCRCVGSKLTAWQRYIFMNLFKIQNRIMTWIKNYNYQKNKCHSFFWQWGDSEGMCRWLVLWESASKSHHRLNFREIWLWIVLWKAVCFFSCWYAVSFHYYYFVKKTPDNASSSK